MTIKKLQQLMTSRRLGSCRMPGPGRTNDYAKLDDLLTHAFSTLASDGRPAAIALVVYGSAIRQPKIVTKTRRRYMLFGEKITQERTVYPEWNDIDIAVICRENQFDQRDIAGEVKHGYDYFERISRDIHMLHIGIEELRQSAATSSISAHILQEGFVFAGEDAISLPLLCEQCGLKRSEVNLRADWRDGGDTLNVHIRYTEAGQVEEVPVEDEVEETLLDTLLGQGTQ